MSQKFAVMTGMIIGSIVGGYVPVLWGADFLSYWGIVTSTIGALLGIYVGYKLLQSQ